MNRNFYRVSEEEYAALAEKIREKLMSPHYFTGAVEVEGAGGEILRLVASLILYRRSVTNPANGEKYGDISDVSAVWWDFYCEDEDGLCQDDFDFDKLCNYIIDRY